jgi:peptidoglycan LD-endopeptidase LytH
MQAIRLTVALCAVANLIAATFVPIEQRTLGMPVKDMRLSDAQDTFNEARSGGRHEATDILAARGTPILAVEDGTIRKLFLSKPGGITIYEFDPSEHYCYYYAHLERYAADLKEGMSVKRGDTIGYVGTTGDAPANQPHLHFGITIIGADKHWWGGMPINPYPLLRDSYLRLHPQGR